MVRITRVFQKLLSVQGCSVKGLKFEDGSLILEISRRFRLLTCPRCGGKARGRESTRIRRWRHLAVWGTEVLLEGEIRRMWCRKCDAVVTEAVPWARHGSDFTIQFEDAVALLAQQMNKTAVAAITGIAWVTVGTVCERVVVEKLDPDRLKSLRRISVDEISFRKRHKYLTVVTDHDSRRVIWVAEGKSSEVLKQFFAEIGQEACSRIEIVTMDMSAAFEKAVREVLPNAEIAFDHFHIAKLANEALDEVRRALMREAGDDAEREAVKGTRWGILHRMENVPDRHAAVIQQLRPESRLGRAYLLKESLLDILRHSSKQTITWWLGWASRSQLEPFVRLARTLRSHRKGIEVFMRERITNGLAEGMNNKIRLLSHRAFGFHSAASLCAMILLCCAGITLPNLHLL